jgi:hypothetical protein
MPKVNRRLFPLRFVSQINKALERFGHKEGQASHLANWSIESRYVFHISIGSQKMGARVQILIFYLRVTSEISSFCKPFTVIPVPAGTKYSMV